MLSKPTVKRVVMKMTSTKKRETQQNAIHKLCAQPRNEYVFAFLSIPHRPNSNTTTASFSTMRHAHMSAVHHKHEHNASDNANNVPPSQMPPYDPQQYSAHHHRTSPTSPASPAPAPRQVDAHRSVVDRPIGSSAENAADREAASGIRSSSPAVETQDSMSDTHTAALLAASDSHISDNDIVRTAKNGIAALTGDFRYDAQLLVIDELESDNVHTVNRTQGNDADDNHTFDDMSAGDVNIGANSSSPDGVLVVEADANAAWWRTLVVLLVFGVCAGIYGSKWA